MLAVLIAHFAWIYFGRHPGTPFDRLLQAMYFASPTFMLTSGIVLGFVHDARPERFGAFRRKLIDRGLFLLTIGHVVISLAYVQYAGGIGGAFRNGQILDPIGIAIILGPLLVPLTSPSRRLLIATALVGASWWAVLAWDPAGGGAQFLKQTMVGGGGWWAYNFPIVPWLSVYLVGTCLGQSLFARQRSGDPRSSGRLLMGAGLGAIGGGLLLTLAGRVLLDRMPATTESARAVGQLFSPLVKLPPSPAYLLFWSGVGLLLIFAVHVAVRSEGFPRSSRLAQIVGRNSLFIFLFQEHLYVLVLWTWNPPYGAFWPLLLLATIVVSVSATYAWHLLGWSRWLTVGYGRWWGPRPRPARPRSVGF